jgi:glycosidase
MAAPASIKDIDFSELSKQKQPPTVDPLGKKGEFYASPAAWEDQILYFFLPDRFSDDNESVYWDPSKGDHPVKRPDGTPLYNPALDSENATQAGANDPDENARHWRNAGGVYVGGRLKGITSKLGYLHGLGVTALWIGPIFKQMPSKTSYHGYAMQDFLEIEPRLGTREDLQTLVETAHTKYGIRVILDIILNHSGDVFAYQNESERHPWTNKTYPVKGFRNAKGEASLPFRPVDRQHAPENVRDDAIWPAELQEPTSFTQKGTISNWDWYPEYLDGDFEDLKDIALGPDNVNNFQPSAALKVLCEVYKYWIVVADIDGFRIDTVKHMGDGPTRFFASVIHEFAQSLGKENFFLVGEVTGGRDRAVNTVERTGINAALGIDDVQDKLEYLIKGQRNPIDYFDLFRNSLLVQKESHVWFRNKVVTMIDDHDQVRKGGNKARFCAAADGLGGSKLIVSAIGLNLCTLGIPCIYYGSEQAFDGAGDSDKYIREAMFGGKFGPFRSHNRHCFDADNPIYQQVAKIINLRADHIALRRGRQYLREISADGVGFGIPYKMPGRMLSVVAWSRIFADKEIVCAINTHPDQALSAWVTIDKDLHQEGGELRRMYATNEAEAPQTVPIQARNGLAARIRVPSSGFVVYS